jgi:hypothetical protein
MTYVEFPVDNIVGVHWFDPDDPPPIDPDNPPEHKCGEYILDTVALSVPLGPTEYTAGFAAWLTGAGIFFNPRFGQPAPPDAIDYPYTDPRDIQMLGVLRYEIEWQVVTGSKINDNSLQYPNGTPLTRLSGSGIGLGYSNILTDDHFRLGSYPASPHPPNIATGATGDITGVGSSITSGASGGYDAKHGGNAALWLQATGEIQDLHNIHTEPAPPDGWMMIDYFNISYHLKITAFCIGAEP